MSASWLGGWLPLKYYRLYLRAYGAGMYLTHVGTEQTCDTAMRLLAIPF